MLKFPVYWTEVEKINFLQRIILIHSYLYYEKDNSIWTDKQYDEIAKQLAEMQNKHDVIWIKGKTQYGYAFYDFDGSTGFYLFHRLDRKGKKQIAGIAENIIGRQENGINKRTGVRRTQKNVELDSRPV